MMNSVAVGRTPLTVYKKSIVAALQNSMTVKKKSIAPDIEIYSSL